VRWLAAVEVARLALAARRFAVCRFLVAAPRFALALR
jgi:hypothetical protein